MIRHVALLRWKEGVDPAHAQVLADALRRLPASIPQVAEYSCGGDLGAAQGNYDFGISVRFATIDDYYAYRDHPDHQAVLRGLIAPFVAERAAVQFSED